PSLPHLVWEDVALEDVSSRDAYPALDVGRPEHLEMLDAIANFRRVDGDRVEDQLPDLGAAALPIPLRQLVGGVLGKDAHHMASRRRDGGVVGGLEVELAEADRGLAGPAGLRR